MVAIERLMPNHDRFSPRHFVGLVIGFGGIVVLVWPEIRLGQAPGFLGGVLATQMGCAGWALGSAYARRRQQGRERPGGCGHPDGGSGSLWGFPRTPTR
jgi:drug/metabolite transporter (DMT)-like permease